MTPTVVITSDEIDAAYNELARQIRHKAAAERTMFAAQNALETTRRQFLRGMEPCDLGKNTEQREAKLAELCATELAAVKECERFLINDREHFDLAKLQVERIKQKLKLAAIEYEVSG